jgi:murein DD-endopeptidase MepM/ murein hydrolase activator NlpD
VKRVALAAAVLVAALVAAGARADTFSIVPTPFVTSLAPDATATKAPLPDAELMSLWQNAGAEYGVPWQVLAAINKIESNFGRNMGPSSAGAIGWMQFMPSTWMRWGVDANGDGVADPWNATDAIYSAARYLSAAGASTNLYRAIFAYNHADWYVDEVLSLADLYGSDGGFAFSLDQMQQSLDSARTAVVAAAAGLQHAQAREAKATLLSDQLALEPAVANARTKLANARLALAKAQHATAAVSFAPAASTLLAGPTYQAGYAFPVGGGPGVVTASHTHHDYPAVDIAAPLGSPVYALSDGVVVRTWSKPDPACGLGFTMRASDGQTWTYCHMAIVDASVATGSSLSAGQQVGLVGATGDATGPHLHLQLQPATEWPQQEAWFQSFAGSAFSWSDGPSASATAIRTPAVFTASSATRPSTAVAAGSRSGSRVFQVVKPAPVVLFSRG